MNLRQVRDLQAPQSGQKKPRPRSWLKAREAVPGTSTISLASICNSRQVQSSPSWTNGAHNRAIDKAVTPLRMGSYLSAAGYDQALARRLYIWDRDISSALLADIAIVEVALRNALSDQLERVYGPRWFEQDLGFDGPTRSKLSQAWDDLPQGRRTPGHLVARLMFGFWRGLLEPGGYVGRNPQRFRADHDDLWRSGLAKAFPGGKAIAQAEGARFTRSWTLETVLTVGAVRNRAAHHEPFINGFPLPGQQTRLTSQQGHEACLKLARLLDRDLGSWLSSNTTVPTLRSQRPV